MLSFSLPRLFFSLFPLLLFPFHSFAADPNVTVYDVLPKFGLPPGLLPDTVTSYSLGEDGAFSVKLAAPCYIQFDYLVYYDKSISGTLKVGSIRDLKGVQVKKFLLWLDVSEIKVDLPPSDYIYFEVGFITKKLEVDQFQTVHSCQAKATALRGCSSLISVEDQEPRLEFDMLVTE